LFKAGALRPNTAFRVTAKGADDARAAPRRPRLWQLAAVLAALEAGCVLFALLCPLTTRRHGQPADPAAGPVGPGRAVAGRPRHALRKRSGAHGGRAPPHPGPGAGPLKHIGPHPRSCRRRPPGHRKAWLRWRGRPHHGLYRLPPPQSDGPGPI
jgi:hypothetical protein